MSTVLPLINQALTLLNDVVGSKKADEVVTILRHVKASLQDTLCIAIEPVAVAPVKKAKRRRRSKEEIAKANEEKKTTWRAGRKRKLKSADVVNVAQ